jgi:hypothetical protein
MLTSTAHACIGLRSRAISKQVFPSTGRASIEVTAESIAKALEGSTMKTLQNSVSLPAIKRYVDMLKGNSAAPAIKVVDGIIVDGNHRYIAGRLMGIEPPIVPGTLSTAAKSAAKPIQQIKVDVADWGNK